MGKLTTHVLDTARGRPGAGIDVELRRLDADGAVAVARARTNADGRTDAPLLEGDDLRAGRYELAFTVSGHLAGEGFLEEVAVRFRIDDDTASYHVPLLFTPWSCAIYRGS